jgi:hypothetical protein
MLQIPRTVWSLHRGRLRTPLFCLTRSSHLTKHFNAVRRRRWRAHSRAEKEKAKWI